MSEWDESKDGVGAFEGEALVGHHVGVAEPEEEEVGAEAAGVETVFAGCQQDLSV